VSAQVAPHETLVEVLRTEFGLHGARESCGQGHVRCCTVLGMDSAPSRAASYLASLCDRTADVRHERGRRCSARRGAAAFVDRAACNAVLHARLRPDDAPAPRRDSRPGEDEIRHYLSEICAAARAYPEIIEAVKLAAREKEEVQ
jgi:carbon-monoxide dehydrogenase small subunit